MSALSSNANTPPTANTAQAAATKLQIEASRLPAPFQHVLLDVSEHGAERINMATRAIMSQQAMVEMDRLLGQLRNQVGEPCRRGISGRFPFADSPQEATIADVDEMFGNGGQADIFFEKFMRPLVDTGSHPWRYKTPEAVSAESVAAVPGADGQAGAAAGPTVRGELARLLAQAGPNPESFGRIAAIRNSLYRAGAKKLALRMDLRVDSLDPAITRLVLNFDGQTYVYAHGPVETLHINWPGQNGGAFASISAEPRITPSTSTLAKTGPWALLRLLKEGQVIPTADQGKVAVEFKLDGRRVVLVLDSGGVNPLSLPQLRDFTCPGGGLL